MAPRVREVKEEREIEKFIRFAWEVYRGNTLWVPPNIQETKNFLKGSGTFFSHCRHKLFAAEENSKIVATAAAFYDKNLADHWNRRVGLVGFFEALDGRLKAVEALFQSAEEFLRAEGADAVWAPVNGGIANPAGLLENAFNQAPVFLMNYNPSYYRQYFSRLKYRPVQELIAYSADLLNGRLRRKVGFMLRRAQCSEVKIRPFDRTDFRKDSDAVARIYADTFNTHWGYAPQSEEEVYEILKPLQLAIDTDFILFAEHEGTPVGFVLAVPDYNPVFRKLNGKFDFLNTLSFIYLKKHIREARLIAVGVAPEWRGKRVAPLLVASVYDAMIRKGYIKCEYSWVFKDNVSSRNVAEKFYGDDYKRYCVYGKELNHHA